MVEHHGSSTCLHEAVFLYSVLQLPYAQAILVWNTKVVLPRFFSGTGSVPIGSFPNTVDIATMTSFQRLESPIINENVPGTAMNIVEDNGRSTALHDAVVLHWVLQLAEVQAVCLAHQVGAYEVL